MKSNTQLFGKRGDYCLRRLVVEYLNRHWGNLSIIHIV